MATRNALKAVWNGWGPEMAIGSKNCAIQLGNWQFGLHNAQSQLGVTIGPGLICANFGAKYSLTSRNAQLSLGVQCWDRLHKSRDEGGSSFSRLLNAALVKPETGTRLARLTDRKLKESKLMICMMTLSDNSSDK